MASLKRKSNVANLPRDKSATKRQRKDAHPAHPATSVRKSAEKQSKSDHDLLKSTRSIPTSLLPNEQPAFPRGGASLLTPIERKQIQAQATRDALKEHAGSGDLFSTTHQSLDDSEGEGFTQDAPTGLKKKREKASKQKPLKRGIQEAAALRIEGLSYKVSMI